MPNVLGLLHPYRAAWSDRCKDSCSPGVGTKATRQSSFSPFRWYWNRIGSHCYPNATSILWLCDAGGSNSATQHLFKQDLQTLVNDLDVEIRVAHYPSYCSKFNTIKRRFFPHVGRACQGMLFDTLATRTECISRVIRVVTSQCAPVRFIKGSFFEASRNTSR